MLYQRQVYAVHLPCFSKPGAVSGMTDTLKQKRKIIIDCDPGQDDAVMLLLALACPDRFDILGITTVAGNVPLELTQRNARIICELAGRHELPVHAGSEKPMRRQLLTAENVHGKDGIDGMEIYSPSMPLQSRQGVDFIIDTLLASADESVTLVPTGPLTNIGLAISRQPAILPRIREIVLMGGAMREGGNFSPCAEFNMLVDPDAAKIVLGCGRPVTMAPLDVTHKVLVSRQRLEPLRRMDTPVSRAVVGMLEFFNRFDTNKYGSEGAPLHDPCTIAYLLEPGLFKSRMCNVEIETESALTLGHTAVDFWHVTDRLANVNWLYDVDADGFFSLLTERLRP
jgi:purine nucleosidase